MKKSPSDYINGGYAEWQDRKSALKAGKPNAYVYFKNIAVTIDDDLCLGMSYNIALQRYSCSAIKSNGVRANDPHRWDKYGVSLDGLSDLNMDTIYHDGISRI